MVVSQNVWHKMLNMLNTRDVPDTRLYPVFGRIVAIRLYPNPVG